MLPLVSCLMPTRNRRAFVPGAIACYQKQTYANKELIIVDNSDESIADLIPPGVTFKYLGPEKLSTGEMRNRACSLARGAIFCHFDDDDYSHPKRITEQVRRMMSMNVSVTGYNEMYFIDEAEQKAWLYRNPEFYALGTSLMYSKDYWRGGKFPDQDVAEDGAFIERAQWRRALAVGSAGDRLVARIHKGNTCDKRGYMLPPMWSEAPYTAIRALLP